MGMLTDANEGICPEASTSDRWVAFHVTKSLSVRREPAAHGVESPTRMPWAGVRGGAAGGAGGGDGGGGDGGGDGG